MSMNDPSQASRSPRARTILVEAGAWLATALMLATYLALCARWMETNAAFFACQLAGQAALTWVSFAKRAWQPAAVNFVFGVASIVGLARIALG